MYSLISVSWQTLITLFLIRSKSSWSHDPDSWRSSPLRHTTGWDNLFVLLFFYHAHDNFMIILKNRYKMNDASCGPVQQNTKSEHVIISVRIYPTISPCKLPVARSSAILLIGHSVSWLEEKCRR